MTNYVYSLSYLEPYAYIVHASEGNIMNMIQIKMILNDSGLSCEKDIPFNFTKPKIRSNDNRLILCEPIQMKENLEISILICGYAEYDSKTRTDYYVQPIYPPKFNVTFEKFINYTKNINFMKFQKINSTDIRFLLEGNCYIDTHFKTFCNNTPYDDYTLQYKDTKIYFNSCSDSLYFFDVKTYHFQKVCYEECPTNSKKNEETSECECLYYKNYINKGNNKFECLGETDICKNHNNKYSKTDIKKCAESKQECLDNGYKILNTFCYKTCPENTIASTNKENCECQFHYYVENNESFCFSEYKSCADIEHPIASNTNRCFLSKEDCINSGYKFFNNICYINFLS